MLKFTELEEENIEKIVERLFDSDSYAAEILYSFDFSDPDVSYAVTPSHGCMLVRIFDYGRYLFLYPIELSADASPSRAVLEISEYARREEIGLTFVDVPSHEVKSFIELGFLHLDVDAVDEDSFRVRVKTECELAPNEIEFSCGELTLSEITDGDTADYAAICRDEVLNRFWGYDYKEDMPNAPDEYFLITARESRALGMALCLAVRENGTLVGEVQFFAFDGRGECELAVRISRSNQSRGLGSRALGAAIQLSKGLGLRTVACDVMNENLHSFAMVEKFFTEVESSHPDRKHFKKKL